MYLTCDKLFIQFWFTALLLQCSHTPIFGQAEEAQTPEVERTSQQNQHSDAPSIQEYKNGVPVDRSGTEIKVRKADPPTKWVRETNSQTQNRVEPKALQQNSALKSQNRDRYPVLYDAVPPFEWNKVHSKLKPKSLNTHTSKNDAKKKIAPGGYGDGKGFGISGCDTDGDHDATLHKRVYDPKRIAK